MARVVDNEDDNGDDGNSVPETANKSDKGEAVSAGLELATDATGRWRSAVPRRCVFRRGWMLGDGTGCGKGRQVAAIILDHWLRGRRRALWLSASDKLLEGRAPRLGPRSAGAKPTLSRWASSARGPIFLKSPEFCLPPMQPCARSPAREKRSRLEQIVGWLADGMDERLPPCLWRRPSCSTRRTPWPTPPGPRDRAAIRPPSQQGRAGLRLQNALPDARIIYVSATGATTVPGLAYARRLGLWGGADSGGENALRATHRFRHRHGGRRGRSDGGGRPRSEGPRPLSGPSAQL